MKVFRSVVLSALLYGAESWVIKKLQLEKLEVKLQNQWALCGVSRSDTHDK